jgi:hypothetical protein
LVVCLFQTKRAWSVEENNILRAAVANVGVGHWKKISKLLPQRDPPPCSQHWKKVLDPSLVKGYWTSEEDTKLRLLKSGHDRTWSDIAKHIEGRSAKQCRERWNNSLNPHLKRGKFTPQEDELLMEGWKRFGPRWNLIIHMLPGRTQTKIRDRFKSLRVRHKEIVNQWERMYGSRGSDGAHERRREHTKPVKMEPTTNLTEVRDTPCCIGHGATFVGALEDSLSQSVGEGAAPTFDFEPASSFDELSPLGCYSDSSCPSSPSESVEADIFAKPENCQQNSPWNFLNHRQESSLITNKNFVW